MSVINGGQAAGLAPSLSHEQSHQALGMHGGIIVVSDMSIRVTYKDGVFEPLEQVEGARPGTVYTVFSEEELSDIREAVGWLKVAEQSFEFWNNPADAVYDTL